MFCCSIRDIQLRTHKTSLREERLVGNLLLPMHGHVDHVISNPMLAETFEDVRMKFIAEKVSHNPVIIAYHAEGDGWELNATSAGKTKFWG
jgi:hypothetical protein